MDEGVVSAMVNYFEWLHSAFRCILSMENCGHLDKDLSTSSNPYLKKVCLLYLMRTLFDKGVTYRSNLLNTISEKKIGNLKHL